MVSIVVITFNRSYYLKLCIDSILCQSFKEFEIIIVDDASTDDTESVVKEIQDSRIKYLNFGKIGNLSRLRMHGINAAKYEIVALTDDDDIWFSGKLEKQLNFIDKYPLVCSNTNVIDANGIEIKSKYFENFFSDFEIDSKFLLSNGNCILISTVLLRKSLLEKNGVMPESYSEMNYCEDFTLWMDLIDKNTFYFINENLASIRMHTSVSGGLDNNIKMLLRSISIITEYVDKHPDSLTKKYSYEGILGYRILLNKKYFSKGTGYGLRDLANLIRYISKPEVLNVFIRKKAVRKLKKLIKL
jgi:teichuronic acid biosynthesis glycosyltransferase TuaG